MKGEQAVLLVVFEKMPEDGDGGRALRPQGEPGLACGRPTKMRMEVKIASSKITVPRSGCLKMRRVGIPTRKKGNHQVPEAVALGYSLSR